MTPLPVSISDSTHPNAQMSGGPGNRIPLRLLRRHIGCGAQHGASGGQRRAAWCSARAGAGSLAGSMSAARRSSAGPRGERGECGETEVQHLDRGVITHLDVAWLQDHDGRSPVDGRHPARRRSVARLPTLPRLAGGPRVSFSASVGPSTSSRHERAARHRPLRGRRCAAMLW